MGNKILIADDSKLIISLVRSIFENQADGFSVVSATDGQNAIDTAEKEFPDVILMDWQMPVMSGLEALKVLKSHITLKDIPVIMLTATESSSEAFELGATDLIQKPFNKNELIARVRNILEWVNLRSELKKMSIDREIQRDKLKLQKDILVKQKHEIAEFRELAINTHRYFSNFEIDAHKNNGNLFSVSVPVNDIPMNFLWKANKGSTAYFCLGYYALESCGISLYTASLISILNKYFIENYNDNNILPEHFLTNLFDKINDVSGLNAGEFRFPDLVFGQIDFGKQILQYAGLNIPVFVMKNDKLVELKTDKPELGENIIDLKLTNHKVKLAKGDMVYVLNDGFNEYHKENSKLDFISDELMALFTKIHKKEMSKQKILFEKTFANWQRDRKQVNDILLFGAQL
jgi:CheY-like chemotaxis protein